MTGHTPSWLPTSLFVTGTDTGVGKTVASAALLSLARARQLDVVPMKPIQTGCMRSKGELVAPDLAFCQEMLDLPVDAEEQAWRCPYRYEPACSPHLAAEMEGQPISLDHLGNCYRSLRSRHQGVIVEGAGGVLVPIQGRQTMLDLMVHLQLPVLLVSRPGLGTLNHTFLSLRQLRDAGLEVVGVLFCETRDAERGSVEEDNAKTIDRLGGVPVLGAIPYMPRLKTGNVTPSEFHGAITNSIRWAFPSEGGHPDTASPEQLWDLDRRYLWHPFTRHSAMRDDPFPIIDRGEGIYLFDKKGNRYLDAISSWWACNLGHSHPRLVRAIQRQACRLQHSILGNLSHPVAAELAAELVALFPDGKRRVLFASDGASAVEASLRVAIQYWHNLGQPRRRRFVSLQEGYHGDTWGAMSLGYVSAFHAACQDLTLPVLRADAPFCAGCAWGKTPDACELECGSSMRSLLEQHGDVIAAVIVEPMCQGAAGMRVYAPGFLRELRRWCDQQGALLIADEIAMGMGRTGRMFAFEHAGIDPDIVCLGKGLTGGTLPMSAAILRQSIYDTFDDTEKDKTLYHGHTFAGNPIAAASARECLRIYRDEEIVERAARKGQMLEREIQVFQELPGVRNLRCLGMVAAFEMEDAARALRVRQMLLREGILLRPLGNVLYLMPPLITPDSVIRDTVTQVQRAVSRVATG